MDEVTSERESMEFDVAIGGAGSRRYLLRIRRATHLHRALKASGIRLRQGSMTLSRHFKPSCQVRKQMCNTAAAQALSFSLLTVDLLKDFKVISISSTYSLTFPCIRSSLFFTKSTTPSSSPSLYLEV